MVERDDDDQCGSDVPGRNIAKDDVLVKSLEDLIHGLRNDISKIARSGAVTIQNNNNNNNNTVNVTINQFGKEDLSNLSNLDLDQILYRTKLGLVQLTEHVHFRERSGKNNNVRVSDMKEDIIS